jgi:hypothetical protein
MASTREIVTLGAGPGVSFSAYASAGGGPADASGRVGLSWEHSDRKATTLMVGGGPASVSVGLSWERDDRNRIEDIARSDLNNFNSVRDQEHERILVMSFVDFQLKRIKELEEELLLLQAENQVLLEIKDASQEARNVLSKQVDDRLMVRARSSL